MKEGRYITFYVLAMVYVAVLLMAAPAPEPGNKLQVFETRGAQCYEQREGASSCVCNAQDKFWDNNKNRWVYVCR